MKSGLAKTAAEAIKSLQADNLKLSSEKESLETAIKLAFQLHKHGSVSSENLESLVYNLCEKTKSELDILEKAAEYSIESDLFSFGKIGERSEVSGLDPLTRLLVEEW